MTLDFASPGVKPRPKPQGKHKVLPPVDEDQTVRYIAQLLASTGRFTRTPSDFRNESEGIASILHPYGIRRTAVRMALGLTHTKGGTRRGTAHVPNARLAEHGASTEGTVREVRDAEVFFRAAYIANAAQRMQRAMNEGATQREALRREAPYYAQHEQARAGRLRAAAQVQTAAKVVGWPDERGTLVGWYLNPLLHNEVECKVANGNNFYAEEGTVIGLPGSVHNRCGCYAGPPISGAGLVNDALANVVKLSRSKPKFKLREGRTA